MARQRKYFVQSLARGISVLQAFSSERNRLTLTALAEITGMNRTAIQRFTDTLMELGFLGRDKHKEFYLSPKILSLGFTYLQGSEIANLAASHLKDFSERVGLTVNMAILDNTDIIFLYRQEVHRFLKYDLRAGSRLPSHCTASGKVLLASLDDQELKQRIRKMKLEGTTSHTITDRKKLYQEILKTRANGIGTCDRELSLALYSISTPLLNHEKKVVAAINLSLSSEEATGTVLADAKREIVEQGRNLSKLLGYEGDYPLIIP
ncbi:MAG: helix-turn-helix domain-containing protein [Deltaproteobacteria bacterium]|nr:helix-turn-helix domain-containing protein [Deltaproteobacteria bacterium]